MKDWPPGSYIVMECKKHKLFAVGYKYSLWSKSKSQLVKSMFCLFSYLIIPHSRESMVVFPLKIR